MYILAELAGVAAEILLAHIYFNGFFAKKSRPWWAMRSAYLVVGVLVAVLSFIPNTSFFQLAFYTVLFALIAYFFFNANILYAAYAGISFSGLNILSETLILGIFSLPYIDAQTIADFDCSYLIFIILFRILLLLCILIALTITKCKRATITLPFLLVLIPGYVAEIALGLSFYHQVLSGDGQIPVPILASTIGLLYLNIVVILYAERAKSASDQKLQAELAEHHYAMQEQYYAQLRSEQEETRAMFHDINKYMQAMHTLAAEANVVEVNQMMAETQELFDSLTTVVDVGNNVVSAILNEYRGITKDADIPFDFDVSVPKKLGMSAVDLYILLGNTLDNAIEACQALPAEDRYIRIQMQAYHSILFYQVENPYAKEYPQHSRGKNRGYGLQNVQKCVEKYDGYMSISQEGNKFVLSVRLNDCIPADCWALEDIHMSKNS